METEHEVRRALGRYRASRPYLILPTVLVLLLAATIVVDLADGEVNTRDVLLGLLYLAALVAVWFGPATVISTAGFRRPFRWTTWDQVAAVFPAGPGDPDVLVGLRDTGRSL